MTTANTVTGQKTILLDRDGVINVDIATSVRTVKEFQFLPGSLEALRLLNVVGYTVLIITNQACVGRGELSPENLAEIHETLCTVVKENGGFIAEIFICSHTNEDGCNCRKPEPGLIFQAEKKWSFIFDETSFVGDDVRDIKAAMAAGCKPVLVRTGKGKKTEKILPNVAAYDDLLSYVKTII